MKKRTDKENFKDIVSLALASLLFAVSLNLFLLPGEVVIGGFTGIAVIINHFIDFPAGTMIFLMNIPFLLINSKFYGFDYLKKALAGIAATSLASDITAFISKSELFGEPLTCAVFGGLFMGAACGIIFDHGFTTGGTDGIAWLLKLKFRHISAAKLIFLADAVIVAASYFFIKSEEALLCSFISIYICSVVTDRIMSGSERGKLTFIFSARSENISKAIINTLGRGVTVLDAVGGYTGEKRPVLVCAVRHRELHKLKEIIASEDRGAFIITSDASEVLGRGFGKIQNVPK